MRSVKQEQLKYDLHRELRIRYKEFFESRLAIDVLNHAKPCDSVKKVSSAILALIESDKKTVVDLIRGNPKIIAELREPYFGSCYTSEEEVDPVEALEKICSLLRDDNSALENVMQVHCIFIHRMYDSLEKRAEKMEFVSRLFPSSLFSQQARSRIEQKEKKREPTTQLGIARHPVFSKMLGQSDKVHVRAIDRYQLDCNTDFFKSAAEKAVPLVCGPSGHTGSLMLGAKLYGNLNDEQLKEYALVSFAFLAAGGNHSFHEVMIVAALAGVDFHAGSYPDSIPDSIKMTGMYQELNKRFDGFLNESSFDMRH